MTVLTPVEDRGGRWYKREDLHLGAHGVNGAKLRACQHLIGEAQRAGHTRVVTAASVLSPQSPMAAVVSREHGMRCTVINAAGSPATFARHQTMMIAAENGADFLSVPVGFNPYLQQRARQLADETGAYLLRYGITPDPAADRATLSRFHATGGNQVANLPPGVRTLVLPFGSGNSAAGVLFGLARHPAQAKRLHRVVLMGIGPNRQEWLRTRLADLGVDRYPCPVEHVDLHGTGFARYQDKMPETRDGIRFHPTYEGKIVRYLDRAAPRWWQARDGSTILWIVGGPLPVWRAR
jgi:1-aminocyclopropane-1-carboxylate deaminase/D-cysteine desulfhydrase-like pyridoxal-dependent ACC family enzyme